MNYDLYLYRIIKIIILNAITNRYCNIDLIDDYELVYSLKLC